MRKGRCGRVAWAMAVALLATSIAAAGAIDVRNFLSDVNEVQDKLEEVVGDVEVLASELDKKEADSALDALSDAEEEVDALSGALQRILEAEEEAEVEAADRRSSYVSPLTGQYKATMTIDLVCGMNQFKMLCGLMGLRRTYGDVRQHIWLDVRDEGPGKEDKREMWIKLGGHKPLIRQSWCGPLKFSVPTNDRWRGNQDRAKNEWTVNLTGKEPPCMSGLRSKLANDKYKFIVNEKKMNVRASIKPHSIVGWVQGDLWFNHCSLGDKECKIPEWNKKQLYSQAP